MKRIFLTLSLMFVIALGFGGYLVKIYAQTAEDLKTQVFNILASPVVEYPDYTPNPDFPIEQVEKGEMLVKMGDCISCHTNIGSPNAKPFAGNFEISVPPMGTMFTPNITGDVETGIGGWSEDEFVSALKQGIKPHYTNLYPAFPFIYFSRMHREDILAIRAYLMSVPKVKSVSRPNEMNFPFNIRFLLWGWKLLFFWPEHSEFKEDPNQSELWNRGAYWVQTLGHCSMCHTPMILGLGAPNPMKYLSGAPIDGYFAPNITSAAFEGYSVDDIMDVFKKGLLLGGQGKVLGPMSEVNHNSLMYMPDEELRAIATYLKTVPPIAPKLVETQRHDKDVAENIWQVVCSQCHQSGVMGAPVIGDQANWENRLARAGGFDGLVKNAILGFNSMPAMGTCTTCSKEQIGAAVGYMVERSTPSASYPFMQVVPTTAVEPHLPQATGKQVYDRHCAKCHEGENAPGPLLGDKAAWEPLIAQGMETLFEHTLKGYKGMPPKGGCYTCSSAQVIEAVKYMANESSDTGDYSLW